MQSEATLETDEALMARWLGGDERAFDTLYERWAPRLIRLMARGLFDPTPVNDLVQRAFLQFHRARADFRPGALLRPWLVTIAMNVKRQHLRRLKRSREDARELVGNEEPRSPGHDPVVAQQSRLLHSALRTLPPAQREVIELHWLEGLPFPEVAQVVGAKTSAVKVRAHRGYKVLRAELCRLGVTEAGSGA